MRLLLYFWLLGPVLELTIVYVSGQCLPASMAGGRKRFDPAQRKNVTKNKPLKIMHLGWESSMIMAKMYEILAEEVLGFNVQNDLVANETTAVQLIAGCLNPQASDLSTATCSDRQTRSDYQAVFEIRDLYYKYIAKMNLNSTKFPAVKSQTYTYEAKRQTYMFPSTFNPPYWNTGLDVTYYASFQTTFSNPFPWFANLSSFQYDADIRKCAISGVPVQADLAAKYAAVTEDVQGVATVSGALQFNCVKDGYWWLAPGGCRSKSSNCVPWITITDGTYFDVAAQQAAKWNLPWALGVAANFAAYQKLASTKAALFYYWGPDMTFIDSSLKYVIMPPTNHDEWNDGNTSTRMPVIKMSTWVSYDLKRLAPFASALASTIDLKQKDIDGLLLKLKQSGQIAGSPSSWIESVSCEWLNNNLNTTLSWLPLPTLCLEGYGLADEDNNFTTFRNQSSQCLPCPPGTYSEAIPDDGLGQTYRCVKCNAGQKQPSGASTKCLDCDPGTYSNSAGSALCSTCPKGTYQKMSKQSQCVSCPDSMTTAQVGSLSQDSCVCPSTTFRSCYFNGKLRLECPCDSSLYRQPADPTVPCQSCLKAMVCGQGSDEQYFPCGPSWNTSNASSDAQYPKPAKEYMTIWSDPLDVYKCTDKKTCPGGGVNRCGTGLQGFACGGCLPGWYKQSGACYECSAFEKSIAFKLIPIPIFPVVIAFLYFTSRDGVEKWGLTVQGFGGVIYQILVFCQTAFAILTCFPSMPSALSESLGWTGQSTQVTSLVHMDCLGPDSFYIRFIMKLVAPDAVGVAIVLTWIAFRLVKVNMDKSMLASVYGGIFKTFFITVAQLCFSLFQVYKHPNGKYSMITDPDVLQFSDVWNDLVKAAVVGIIVNCLGFLAISTYAMIVAPKYFSNPEFRKRWKFLISKMRPSAHWWMLVTLIKAIWLSLVSVLFTKTMHQCMFLCLGILMYFTGTFILLPWRSTTVAVMDVYMHAQLLSLFLLTPFLADFGAEEKNQAANIYLAFVLLAAIGSALAVLALGISKLPQVQAREKRKSQELANKLVDIFGKMDRPRLLADMQANIPPFDIVVLNEAARLVKTEVFAIRQPGRLQWRKEGDIDNKPITDKQLSGVFQTELLWI